MRTNASLPAGRQKAISYQFKGGKTAAAITVSALLLVTTCLAAPGPEAAENAKAPVSPPALTAALASTNAATRFYAVDSLGKTGGSDSISPLVKALHDPDACVRIAAAKALGRSALSEVRSALIEVLKTEKDTDVWGVAAKPLVDQGPAAIPSLLDIFCKAEAWEIRFSIGHLLSKLGWKPQTQGEKIAYYISDLDKYMDDLSDIGPAVIPSLVELMVEESVERRIAALQALSGIEDYRVFKPLVKALVDPSPSVRKEALVALRYASFSYAVRAIGTNGYLLLLAGLFLVSLVYAVVKLKRPVVLKFNLPDVKSDSSKGPGTIVRFARVLFSLDMLFVFSCVASLLVFYKYNNAYDVSGPLCILFPAIMMMVVFDMARLALKVAGMRKRESGKALCRARPLRWLKRIFAVAWALGIVYFFVSASLEHIRTSKFLKDYAMQTKSPAAQVSKKDVVESEVEARRFAFIASQAKEAARAIDSRYLDQQQKEQVMDTFVKLISIRSHSGVEGLIRDELKQMTGELGAKEIDCRKGDLSAPFNLVMEFSASEELKDAPAILLNAHIDTVNECTPEGLEFDTVRSDFYHRDRGSYGADDKSGVTMVVEALRTLKRDYWDKGYSHRRVLVVFTAQEESGRQGAEYLATRYRELFDNLDFSITVDGFLWGDWGSYEYPQTPHLAGIFKSKADTFKARQVIAIMEKFAKERKKPVYIGRGLTVQKAPIDAFKFPPEAYKVVMFHTPNHGLVTHGQERNNVGQLIDYVDMLVNVLKQLDEEYIKAVSPSGDEEKEKPTG